MHSARRIERGTLPRVLFVDQTADLGGAELHLADVVRGYDGRSTVALFADGALRQALEEAGRDVCLLEGADAVLRIRKRDAGPPVRALLGVVALARRVASLARAHDLVYANSQKAFVVCALARPLARRPLLWCLHDILNYEHFSRANVRGVVALANRTAARVLTNSHATAAAFAARGGDAARVRVVHNGIDPAPFRAVGDADAAAARRDLGLADAPLLGLFGRLDPWKGHAVAFEALRALPGAHLLVVGSALFGHEAHAEALRAQAEALGVGARVHFLGFRADVPRLMRAVDVVVHASTAAEPFGRVVLEAMLAERPVVATAAGGVPELVEDGVTGVLVPPGDAAALARATRPLLADPARRRTLGVAARRAAEARFGLDAMVARITQEIVEVAPR